MADLTVEGATPTVQYGLAEDDLDMSTVGTSSVSPRKADTLHVHCADSR
jgi:hypothetical protein